MKKKTQEKLNKTLRESARRGIVALITVGILGGGYYGQQALLKGSRRQGCEAGIAVALGPVPPEYKEKAALVTKLVCDEAEKRN